MAEICVIGVYVRDIRVNNNILLHGGCDGVSFDSLLANLDRTQNQLVTALSRVSAEELRAVKDDQTIGEHFHLSCPRIFSPGPT